MTTQPLLSVADLTKYFGGIPACDAVGFDVYHGERIAIIGPNGAGKTTLFNLLSGLLSSDKGGIRFNDRDITRQPAHKRVHIGIARTFQIAMPYRQLPVIDNVALALSGKQRRGSWRLITGLPAILLDQAGTLLAQVGLETQADQRAENLAYGDQKRLELAIAMAARPRLLLLDEPMAGIAHQDRAALMALAMSVSASDSEAALPPAILFTEHDMDIVFDHASRIIVLDHGRVIADGAPKDIANNINVQNIYLGTETSFTGH
jgi:branched-chain amino acid transport system ATP-binding protein